MTMITEAVKRRKMKNKRIRSRLAGGSSCVTILLGLWGHTIKCIFQIVEKIVPSLVLVLFYWDTALDL